MNNMNRQSKEKNVAAGFTPAQAKNVAAGLTPKRNTAARVTGVIPTTSQCHSQLDWESVRNNFTDPQSPAKRVQASWG